MAWTYLAESEESQKPWKATYGQSPIVKTIDTPRASCCHECGAEICQKHPSGMTFSLFQEPCYRKSTSSMEASLVRTLAMLDAEKAWKASEADYFSRSFDSLAKFDQDSSSWKTYQRSLIGDYEPLPQNLPSWGMTVDGEFYPLQMWEHHTEEIVGGYWPTPCAAAEAPNLGSNKKNGPKSLIQVAKEKWPTPRACEWKANNYQGDLKKTWNLTLTGAVRKFLPTPRAFMHKDSTTDRGKSNLGEVIGGQLNPMWVEWLMGYPKEWTVLQDWAMRWFRSVQEKPLRDSLASILEQTICSDPTCTVRRCVRIRKRLARLK